MILKTIVAFFSFYFLILLQTSFLVHFVSTLPNLILIIVLLINLFEDKKENFGMIAAFTGGFFLDIFSENYLGFHIVILFLFSILIKLVLKNYLQPRLSFRPSKPSFQ